MVKIKNQNFCAEIETFGAQLVSLTSEKEEYIWQRDPQYWKSCATLLFPIVGKVKDDTYLVDGKQYHLTQHGIIRHNELAITKQSGEEVVLMLEANEKTLKQYPYKFRFEVIYKMLENGISTVMKVTNIDNKPIYFSIGGHPGFNIPLNENESFDDYYVEFENNENQDLTLLNHDNGLLTKTKIPFLNNQRRFFLNDSLFTHDALVLGKLNSKKVSIKSINHNTSISVLSHDYYPFYGIWKPMEAPLLCLEPWVGHTDFEDYSGEFKNREGTICLEPNGSYSFGYDILVEKE